MALTVTGEAADAHERQVRYASFGLIAMDADLRERAVAVNHTDEAVSTSPIAASLGVRGGEVETLHVEPRLRPDLDIRHVSRPKRQARALQLPVRESACHADTSYL